MSTITQALVWEHKVFRTVFDQVEWAMARACSAPEVKLLASVVERLLRRHGEMEVRLAYSALDHVLEEDGRLNRLHQDHHEMDEHFRHVHRANDLAEAQRLLRKALTATREHFRREEDIVFPFLEQVLHSETLETLGKTWMDSASASKHGPSAARAAE